MLYLTSMETTTSSATQQCVKVEQSMQQPISYCHLLELVILVITRQNSVVQSTHWTMFYSPLREPITSSTTQQSMWRGGTIYNTKQVMLTFNGTNKIIGNSANNSGGAIYTSCNTVLNFTGNHGGVDGVGSGGATDYVLLTFNGPITLLTAQQNLVVQSVQNSKP